MPKYKMTVAEMIEKLKVHPPEAEVCYLDMHIGEAIEIRSILVDEEGHPGKVLIRANN